MAKWEVKTDVRFGGATLYANGESVADLNYPEQANEIARKLNAFDEMLADVKLCRDYAASKSHSFEAQSIARGLNDIVARIEAANV